MRTVGVKLVLDAAEYEVGIHASEGSTKSFNDELDKTAFTAQQAAEDLEKLTAATVIASKEEETFGRSALTAAQHMERLDREIHTTERELQDLAVSFAEAETAADRLDLTKAIRKTQTDLRNLKSSKSLLAGLLPSESEAKAEGDKVGKGLLAGLLPNKAEIKTEGEKVGKDLGEAVGTSFSDVLLPIGIAAAPLLLSALSTAVTAGVGLGFIGVGILAAVKSDTAIQAAGKLAGTQFLTGIERAAAPFKGPILQAITLLSDAGKQLTATLAPVFAKLSQYVVPFTQDVIRAAQALMSGLARAAANSGPAIGALGDGLVTVSKAVGDLFVSLSSNGAANAKAFSELVGWIADLIKVIGPVINGISDLLQVMSFVPEKIGQAREAFLGLFDVSTTKVAPAVQRVTDAALAQIPAQKGLATAVLSTGEAAGIAGLQMQTFADKMNDAAEKGRGLYDSQTAVQEAIDKTQAALKANGKTLDATTEKGRANRTQLSQLAGTLEANYAAYVKVNGEGGKAAGIARMNRDTFIKLATSFTHSKAEAEKLATQLGLIPAKKITDFYANTHDAAGRIAALNGQANYAARARTLRVNVSVTGAERLDNLGHRVGGYRASGGPVTAGMPYVVGEHRPEVFVPDSNGTIIPSVAQYASAPARMMPAAAAQKVIVETRNVVEFAGGADAFGQLMLNTLRVKPGIRKTMATTLGVTG